jgi:V/A-type H+-transporting ATPase subunit D
MIEQVNPTRMELLAKRAQIALAQQGRDLLKEKRTALWKEMIKTVEIELRESTKLELVAEAARRALAWAEAIDGREAVQSAAFAARRNVAIDVTSASVFGVPVPAIEQKQLLRSSVQRGYGLVGTSTRIDAAAERFEEQLELVIERAAAELRLRRLADAIRKTTIRVNALELVLLPRLAAQRTAIERVLEERERENMFRMKRVKAAIRRTRGERPPEATSSS